MQGTSDYIDGGGDEIGEKSVEVLEALLTQLAGLLHKLVHVTSLLTTEMLKCARIQEGLKYLRELLLSIDLWNKVRPKIASGVWGADKTMVNLTPIVWSILGELLREVYRQTVLSIHHSAPLHEIFFVMTGRCLCAQCERAGRALGRNIHPAIYVFQIIPVYWSYRS